MRRSHRFWTEWLTVTSAGVVLFGLVLVAAPSLARQGFSLLVYANPDAINAFGSEPIRYVSLAHAVIGGVMIGWGAALVYVTRALFSTGNPIGWRLIAISVAAWFVPDTSYSLLSGYWQNAALNVAFLLLFAIPLWATRSHFQKP
jgi:hypothetical protein